MADSFRKPTYKKIESEEALLKKLYIRIFSVIAIIVFLVVSISSFGPKIGSLFMLISKNRNNDGSADTIPPVAPIFSHLPESTKEKKININGITEPGATVKIFINGPQKAETTADNDGMFTFVDLEIGEGNNTVFAKAVDINGNESENSKTFEIVYDDKKPDIDISSPKNGETVKNLNQRVTIQGKLNEEAEVTINGRNAVVKSDLTFELLLGVNEGNITITIEAIDKAGNKATEVINVTYQKTS